MIRTNLATRPFYNTRAVSFWLASLAVVAAAATLFNVARVAQYSRSDSTLAGQAALDTEQATTLRQEAARLRGSVDTAQVLRVSAEAGLANDLIDRRVFSWTELFNRFEQTLPPDVRITSVRPTVDKDGRIMLAIAVVARGVDDVNQFMENLEATGSFQSLLSRQEQVNDEDQLEALLESYYSPAQGVVAGTPPSGGQPVAVAPPSGPPPSEPPTAAEPAARETRRSAVPSTDPMARNPAASPAARREQDGVEAGR